MIQTSRLIKFTCFLVKTLSLFISTLQANAGVRIQQWLENIWNRTTRERTLHWTNSETGLRYTLDLNSRISGKLGQGFSTFITVDLNPILGLKNHQRYFRKTYFNIYRNVEGNWNLK